MRYAVVTEIANQIGRAGAPEPTSDSASFPAAKLYDREAQEIFSFDSAGADDEIVQDVNLVAVVGSQQDVDAEVTVQAGEKLRISGEFATEPE
jgi:hypothetical protein